MSGLVCWMLALAAAAAAPPSGPPGLALDTGATVLDAWSVARIQWDASRERTAAEVIAHPERFEAPARRGGALGVRQDALWVQVPLQVTAAAAAREWVASLDYSSLLEVDFYLVRDGRIVQHAVLGYGRTESGDVLGGRTPSMRLQLTHGPRYELLLRVRTLGPLILPLKIAQMPQHLHRTLQEQTLQGLLLGLALGLLAYSLLQALTQRDRSFAYYALVVMGSAGFSLQFFGVGSQFLWPDQAWLERRIAPVFGLLALSGSFLFLRQVLASATPGDRYARAMGLGALASAAMALGVLAGVASVPVATAFLSVAGPLPSVLSLPRALRRVRARDRIGAPLLVAWVGYGIGAAVMVALAQGWVAAHFWTLHAFQFGATLDMLLFLRVLSLRAQALREAAQHALRERDAMHALAHTDPLTGLPNRRGMHLALSQAVAQATPERPVALYVMDLDGFKPVNDQHGHDVGDELLLAVSQRLREQVQAADVVARPGGDEFVLLSRDVRSEQNARQLGERLLEAFETPFVLGALQLHVGLTIGYVIAPQDGRDAADLIRQADQAMYRGKEDGKHCLRRGHGGESPA